MKLLNVLLLTTSLSAFYTYAETDYQWLRDDSRSEPAVKQFLAEHNRKTDHWFAPAKPLVQELVNEWQQTSQHKAPPPALIYANQQYNDIQWNGHRHIVKIGAQGQIEPLLNLSARAEPFDYYQLASWSLDRSVQSVALAEDTRGDEQFKLTIVRLADRTEQIVSETASTYFAWAADGKSLYYLSDLNGSTQLQRFELETGQSTRLAEWRSAEWLFSLYSPAIHAISWYSKIMKTRLSSACWIPKPVS